MSNKRSIPELRERLYQLADETKIVELRYIADETYRNPQVRRAPNESAPLTPALAAEIRTFARANPRMSQRKIAQRFNVNPGRVSEALNRLV